MIDAKKVDEIRERHAAMAMVACINSAPVVQIHADRGYLLDAIAEMQKPAAPRVFEPPPALASLDVLRDVRGMTERDAVLTLAGRLNGARASVAGHEKALADAHAVIAQFKRATGWDEPVESQHEEGSPRVFKPTAEDVAACPVLADVAGLPKREAVMCLGQLFTDAAAREKRAWEVAKIRETEANGLRALRSQRPRVGPWVGDDGAEARWDDRGACVGNIGNRGAEGWTWFVVVPLGPPKHGGQTERLTKEQAREAVDAVLREWADLDGEPT